MPSSRKAHRVFGTASSPREGFVFAITPFNFTAIAGNLPISAALMGNVVVWKPSDDQIYSAHVIMELLHAAGLPEGVINLVTVDGPAAGDVVFSHPDFAGLHFTGSTGVFRHLWQTIGQNIAQYKTYPRIVGETGGKDFILAHASANVDEVVTALCAAPSNSRDRSAAPAACTCPTTSGLKSRETPRGSRNAQGGYASRPDELHGGHQPPLLRQNQGLHRVRPRKPDAEILCGGGCDDSLGYFVQPTVVLAKTPHFKTMERKSSDLW